MSVDPTSVPVEVTLRGVADDRSAVYARTKVTRALAVARGPVLQVHVVLDGRHDPAVGPRAIAEATADVNGAVVRAKSSAPTTTEAVDQLEERLRRRVAQLQARRRDRHRWTSLASAHEWRHGDARRRPVPYFPRPEQSREVVRRKSFASSPLTVDEAIYEMEMLDHDFFLYRDSDTGEPALVHRLPGGRYGAAAAGAVTSAGPVVGEPPPPSLSEAEARERLEADGEPFVFYLDRATGRGRVLYHRYDGHYGLIDLAP